MKRVLLSALSLAASAEGFTISDDASTRSRQLPFYALQDSQNFVDRSQITSDQLFAKFPLLEDILNENEDLVVKLGSELETIEVLSNQVLVNIGDPWDSIYFLIEGELQCNSASSEVKYFLPGDSFGEVSLLCDHKISGLQVKGAAAKSTLFRLGGEVFDRLVDDGTFTTLLLKYVARKMTSGTPAMALTAAATRTVAAFITKFLGGDGENVFALSSPSLLDPRLYLDDTVSIGAGDLFQDTFHLAADLWSGLSPSYSIHVVMALACAHALKERLSEDER